MKIYTKTGDDGTTGLFSAGRVRKDSARIRAYGDIDELNSVIGFAIARDTGSVFGSRLVNIQRLFFVAGADLATPLTAKVTYDVPRIRMEDTEAIEQLIDEYEASLPPLAHFVLPGGSELASILHIARTVARRAEREIVTLSETEELGECILPFVNRLSDLFFVLARYANARLNTKEDIWDGKRPQNAQL
jgi:cob(I)alamin adenosyltransferase